MPVDDDGFRRSWRDAQGPDELTTERNWRALSSRIAAGDLGPELLAPARASGLSAAKLIVIAVVAGGLASGTLFVAAIRQAPVPAAQRPAAQGVSVPPRARVTAPPRGASEGTCRSADGPYTDPSHLAIGPGDERGRLLHPWRGWLDTLPATRLSDGVGAFLNLGDLRGADPELVVAALARGGVRHLGVEINWNQLSWDETLDNERGRQFHALLVACRRHGLRPTIRVGTHEASPCPTRGSRRRLAAPARAGDRSLVLEDTRELVPGHSGISMLSRDVAAEILVTAVTGQTVTLSAPLPFDLAQGRRLSFDTLKYRPFAPPGTTDYANTAAGWRRYLDAVADLATRALGTAGAPERGFDLELWNSVAFASRFLYLGRYYDPPGPGAADDRAWRQLAIDTAGHLSQNPARFAGVGLINGFATHQPGQCPEQPAPFVGVRRSTPGVLVRPLLQGDDGRVADPLLWPWPAAGRRGVALAFPEVEATWLTPESYVQELALSRDRPAACGVFISGAGIDPRVVAPLADAPRAQVLKAKLVLRQYAFFLGKGARRVMIGAAPSHGDRDDRAPGLLSPAFLQRARPPATVEGLPISAALSALGRLVAVTTESLQPLVTPRALQVRDVVDCHDHVQFRGGPADPILYNRDVLVVLPFQVGPGRFVVHHYVMTRDISADLPPERYTLTIGGLAGAGARVRGYDPLRDRAVPAHVERAGPDQLVVTVEATDTPRALIIEE